MAQAWNFSSQGSIGRLVFDTPNSDINILTSQNLAELDTVLSEIAGRQDLKALLISSAKPRIFIAGADIKEIEEIHKKEDAFSKAEQGKRILQKLEDLKFPTVCAIGGACLGGGYELALACRY